MDLNLIQVFSEITKNESFTKAGTILKMDKSTISSKLNKLETILGQRLLNRSTRSVTLTEAGATYYRYCQQILETAKEAELVTINQENDAFGLLRISTTNVLSNYFINKIIDPYMLENTKVDVELVLGYEQIDLAKAQIDIALRLDVGAKGLKDSSLIAKKFNSSEIGLFCSPSYKKKLGVIASLIHLDEVDFIEFTRGSSLNLIHKFIKNQGHDIKIKTRLKVNDINTCKEAAISGLGVVILPKISITEELKNKQLIQLLPKIAWPKIDLYAVYQSREWLPNKVKKFIEYLYKK